MLSKVAGASKDPCPLFGWNRRFHERNCTLEFPRNFRLDDVAKVGDRPVKILMRVEVDALDTTGHLFNVIYGLTSPSGVLIETRRHVRQRCRSQCISEMISGRFSQSHATDELFAEIPMASACRDRGTCRGKELIEQFHEILILTLKYIQRIISALRLRLHRSHLPWCDRQPRLSARWWSDVERKISMGANIRLCPAASRRGTQSAGPTRAAWPESRNSELESLRRLGNKCWTLSGLRFGGITNECARQIFQYGGGRVLTDPAEFLRRSGRI